MTSIPYRSAPASQQLHVKTRFGRLPVALRRSERTERMTLKVRTAFRDLTLTAPPTLDLASIRAFLDRNAGWIEGRLAALPDRIPFETGETVPVRGVGHRIIALTSARGVTCLGSDPFTGAPLIVAYGGEHAARRIRDMLKAEARRDLEAAVRRHARALGVEVGRISIKDTTTRWGSCSSEGDLSFSWRLILTPALVLDYLAAHEVAHRLEMNHSPAYWRHVARIFPDFERAEAWLTAHGPTLHRYG